MLKRDYAVVIIARDEEKRIGKCLAALNDAGEENAYVVVDNRTTDRTYDIAKEYTPHVKVVEGQRGRLRNEGYKWLGLPFVAFVDADMYVTAGYLGTLRRFFEEDDRLAIAGGMQTPADCCLLGALDCQYWNYRKAIGTGGTMFRTRTIEETGDFDERLNIGEDAELIARIIRRGWHKRWTDKVHIGHLYAADFRSWKHKISHGAAAGLSLRGLLRLFASPVIGLHAAIVRREIHMLWYIPYRSTVLLFGPGIRKEYVPLHENEQAA